MNKNLEYIFHQFYSPLCNYAAKITRDSMAAEDIVQSIFIQLYEKNKLVELKNIESYLIQCVKFKCFDHLKNKSISKDYTNLPEQFDTPSEIREEDIEPLFHYYAAKLPPKTREVFLLSRINKLTYKEIAEEVNVSQKTVENQMGTALKKLRGILKDEHYFLLTL